MLEVLPHTSAGPPEFTKTTFPACRAQYPGGSNRCLSVSSLSARPSPVNWRVSIHDFTFEACSSFTSVTAYWVACPPKGGLFSRGFDPASCPTAPPGSYHVSPTTTWVDPPSTSDLRHWGAQSTKSARLAGEAERFTLKERVGRVSQRRAPWRERVFREYWPFSRHRELVRQPEAPRTRSGSSSGSSGRIRTYNPSVNSLFENIAAGASPHIAMAGINIQSLQTD